MLTVALPSCLKHQRLLPIGTAFALAASLCAQTPAKPPVKLEAEAKLAGDTVADAGPLAQGLSPKLDRKDLAKAMKLVADWQLKRLPQDHAEIRWTFAALYTGMMAVPDAVNGATYKNAMLDLSQRAQWQPGPRVMHADDQAIGQTYLELYLQKPEADRLAPIRARMDTEMAAPDDPAKPLWWWCDALFMAPPVLADLSVATHDPKYLTFMDHEWQLTQSLLYDQKAQLFSRDATFLEKHEANGQKVFWARGNGWVMAGIVRVLERLPADSPLRPKYVHLLQQMADATAAVQGADGLWRPGLLDAESYKLPEISGSGFITYAMAYGVHHKLLDARKFNPVIQKAWAGMLTHIYADGRLGCIQPIGSAPGAFTETSSYVYGVGAFLLAGSELYTTAH